MRENQRALAKRHECALTLVCPVVPSQRGVARLPQDRRDLCRRGRRTSSRSCSISRGRSSPGVPVGPRLEVDLKTHQVQCRQDAATARSPADTLPRDCTGQGLRGRAGRAGTRLADDAHLRPARWRYAGAWRRRWRTRRVPGGVHAGSAQVIFHVDAQPSNDDWRVVKKKHISTTACRLWTEHFRDYRPGSSGRLTTPSSSRPCRIIFRVAVTKKPEIAPFARSSTAASSTRVLALLVRETAVNANRPCWPRARLPALLRAARHVPGRRHSNHTAGQLQEFLATIVQPGRRRRLRSGRVVPVPPSASRPSRDTDPCKGVKARGRLVTSISPPALDEATSATWAAAVQQRRRHGRGCRGRGGRRGGGQPDAMRLFLRVLDDSDGDIVLQRRRLPRWRARPAARARAPTAL